MTAIQDRSRSTVAVLSTGERRLVNDEEERLLEAVRMEDKFLSIENRVEELLAPARALAARQASEHASKLVIRDAYDAARREALESYTHVRFLETFVLFQLGTAARRRESLSLTWEDIDFSANTAFVHDSKNGRPRRLSVRQGLLEMLRKLPRNSALVFDIGERDLRNAWSRICETARLEDFHIQDLRHEALSRAAESGQFPTLLNLQAYSGHRDLRSLSRYVHKMPSTITERLEALEVKLEQHRQELRRHRLTSTEMLEVEPAPSSRKR